MSTVRDRRRGATGSFVATAAAASVRPASSLVSGISALERGIRRHERNGDWLGLDRLRLGFDGDRRRLRLDVRLLHACVGDFRAERGIRRHERNGDRSGLRLGLGLGLGSDSGSGDRRRRRRRLDVRLLHVCVDDFRAERGIRRHSRLGLGLGLGLWLRFGLGAGRPRWWQQRGQQSGELGRGGGSVGRLLGHGLADGVGHGRRHAPVAQVGHLDVSDAVEHGEDVDVFAVDEGRLAGQHGVDRGAQGVDVPGRGGRPAGEGLGRAVGPRDDVGAGGVHGHRAVDQAGHAEVRQQRLL